MSWRIVVVSNRSKLDLKMGYMVVRGIETKRIYLDEIAVLLIENPAVSLTGCLLEACNEKKIRVIFCDSKHLPMAELTPYYGTCDTADKTRIQAKWKKDFMGDVWTVIVSEKIKKQAEFLTELEKNEEAALLQSYLQNVEYNDESNREGLAAKVYFNALFSLGYSRNNNCPVNAALNYGYSILLSAFSREICACGYLTQIGIFHDNMFNSHNLSCDLMEPFRILIDRMVYHMNVESFQFEKEQKRMLINILNETVVIQNTKQTVLNAIRIYVRSFFHTMQSGDLSELQFYKI